MLDVRRLRLLSELSRRGTIAEVARVVGYTPSAISQSLARLEREAGIPLLERDGRHVRLTPAAHGLVSRTDRVLAELDAAEAELAAEQETVRGELVIGAFPSAAGLLVAPAIRELSELYPDLACSIREHEPEDGIQLLRSGELDILVSESYDLVDTAPIGGLESHLLLTEPLLLVLPRDDSLPEPVRLDTLKDADWVAGITGTQFAAAFDRACHAAGFAPRIAHRADEAFLFECLVGAGLGIGLLPELACTDDANLTFARVAPPAPSRLVSAFLRRGAARRPAVAEVLEALRRHVGAL